MCNGDEICEDCGHPAHEHEVISLVDNQAKVMGLPARHPTETLCPHDQPLNMCMAKWCSCLMCGPECKTCNHGCYKKTTVAENQAFVRNHSSCLLCGTRGVTLRGPSEENMGCRCPAEICEHCWTQQFEHSISCPLCDQSCANWYSVFMGWQ